MSNKKQRKLQRIQGTRSSLERILIVTEGEKTESNYFNGIKRCYRLSATVVKGNGKTEPSQLVQRSYEYAKTEKFDRVYIVFDRDTHQTYDAALKEIDELNTKKTKKVKNDEDKIVKFEAITSNPCFELWLLLHFEIIQNPLSTKDALEKLKKHIKNYEKSCEDIFQKTKQFLETAYKNAGRLTKQENPYTNVHTLVKFLIDNTCTSKK